VGALSPVYRRRRPERTVLYRIVQEHLSTFLAEADVVLLAEKPHLEVRLTVVGGDVVYDARR
jgi:hypothetical protein